MNTPAPDSTLISQPLKSNNKLLMLVIGILILCCCCFGMAGIGLIALEIFGDALNLL
jgi:hypothetical protein